MLSSSPLSSGDLWMWLSCKENDIFKMSDASSINSYHTESGRGTTKPNKNKNNRYLYVINSSFCSNILKLLFNCNVQKIWILVNRHTKLNSKIIIQLFFNYFSIIVQLFFNYFYIIALLFVNNAHLAIKVLSKVKTYLFKLDLSNKILEHSLKTSVLILDW